MAIVRITRHGETDWNREARYQGHLDTQLSALGRRQAIALADALTDAGIARIISSPLQRCIETARPLAERIGVPIDIDARLIEIAHGIWEGRLRTDVQRDDAQRYDAWKHDPLNVDFPGGESVRDVDARWRSFQASFEAREDTLILTHDVVARVALLAVTGRGVENLWKPRVVNAGYAEYDVQGHDWHLVYECCESHLHGLENNVSAQAL